MVVVHSQSVNDVVDTVELCRRRVGHHQSVDRLAACTPSVAVSVAAIHVHIYLC